MSKNRFVASVFMSLCLLASLFFTSVAPVSSTGDYAQAVSESKFEVTQAAAAQTAPIASTAGARADQSHPFAVSDADVERLRRGGSMLLCEMKVDNWSVKKHWPATTRVPFGSGSGTPQPFQIAAVPLSVPAPFHLRAVKV